MSRRTKYDISGDGNCSVSSTPDSKQDSFIMPNYSKSTLGTPTRPSIRRYSLGEPWSSSSPKRQKHVSHNAHISTKIDGDSPGYTTRVVHYNAEQEKCLQSHHSKYAKLGVFPIVHFFKRDLPSLKRKTDNSSRHIVSSDLSKYNTTEHTRMLLEKVVRSSPESPNNSDINTKSVLDALKEISRKRIQANGEEFVLKEDGKRVRVDHEDSILRKRQKHIPQTEHIEVVSSPPRSVIDELMASQSSMEGYVEKLNRPTCSEHVAKPVKPPTVSVNHVNAQTQTPVQHPPSPPAAIVESAAKEDTSLSTGARIIEVKKESPVKVFDETPLEAMRKNRLTALMGSLTKDKIKQKTDETPISENKPLVSILSTNSHHSVHKTNKHVTFCIPETVVPFSASENAVPNSEPHETTKTSASVITPIVSSSVVKLSSLEKSSTGAVNASTVTPSKHDQLFSSPDLCPGTHITVASSQNEVSVPPTPLNTEPKSKNTENNADKNHRDEVTQNKLIVPPFNRPNLNEPSSESIGQKSGFKFELKQPISIETVTSSQFPLVTTTIPNIFSPPTLSTTTSKNSVGSFTLSPSNTDQRITAFSAPIQQFSFNKNLTTPNFSVTNTSTSFTTLAPILSGSKTSSIQNLGSQGSIPNSIPSTSTSKPNLFSFGSNSNVTTAGFSLTSPSLGLQTFKSGNTTSSSLTFSAPASTVSFTAQPSSGLTSSNFGSSNNSFAAPNSSASILSGTPVTTSSSNTFFSFGSTNASFSKPPPFSANNPAPTFGSSDTGKSRAVPAFGAATGFGSANNTTSNTTNAFSNAENKPNIFGNVNGFGTPTQVPSFGSNVATNSFGQNQKTDFGSGLTNNSAPVFGNTTASALNSTSTFNVPPSFGANRSFNQTTNNAWNPTFGTSTSVAVTGVTPFSNPNSNFGSTNFSANSPTSQSVFNFGSNTKSAVFSFGGNETPKQSFNFQADKSKLFGGSDGGGFSVGVSSPFSSPTPAPFNVTSPGGGNMFNIGTGGSSTPTRSRTQHKTKRRP